MLRLRRRAWLKSALAVVALPPWGGLARAQAGATDVLRFLPLRHSSVLVEVAGRRVLFDPSLQPSFSAQGVFSGPPVQRDARHLGPIDVVCVSSGDATSFDPRTVAQLAGSDAAGPRFLVPDDDVAKRVRQLGFRRVRVVAVGDVTATVGLRIQASPARGILSAGLGYAVEGGGARVWHSGLVPPLEVDADAGIFAERNPPCDVAFVCAWGLRLRSGGPALFADVDDAAVLGRLARSTITVPVATDAHPAGVFSLVFETGGRPTSTPPLLPTAPSSSSSLTVAERERWHRLR